MTPGAHTPWMVFNIGCIECGVSSDIVGFFATEREAQAVAEECRERFSWREGGQNHFAVFDTTNLSDEYSDAIQAAIAKATGGAS